MFSEKIQRIEIIKTLLNIEIVFKIMKNYNCEKFYVISVFIVSILIMLIFQKFLFTGSVSEEEVENLAKLILEESNNIPVEIVTVTKNSDSVYKIVAKIGSKYREYYITSDGKYIIMNAINIQNYLSILNNTKRFITCLKSKNVRFYGNINNTDTQLQLSIFNYGFAYLPDLYYQINEQIARYLLSHNVTRIPVMEYNGTFYQGVLTKEDIGRITGCK